MHRIQCLNGHCELLSKSKAKVCVGMRYTAIIFSNVESFRRNEMKENSFAGSD